MSDTLDLAGGPVELRAMGRGDAAAIARFAAAVPLHDLLFLGRDIRQPRVLDAWIAGVEAGEIESMVAQQGGNVVATTASLRDALSWSSHVCEIRLLVAPALRGRGLGRELLARCIAAAIGAGAAKLTARMTPDQAGAITLFEESGFRAEAMLRDHVKDAAGTLHDLAVLALDPALELAKREAFGEVAEAG